MNPRLPLVFLIAGCLCLSGCPSFSAHPLYTDQDAVMEPALEGTWSAGPANPNDKEVISFQKSGDHAYSLKIVNPETNVRQNYDVHLVRLGDQLLMDLIFKNQTIGDAQMEDPLGVVRTHIVVKVKVSGNDLAYATLEDDLIKKQNTSGKPLPYSKLEDGLLVTAPTEDLRRYLGAHMDDVFSKFEHFQRQK